MELLTALVVIALFSFSTEDPIEKREDWGYVNVRENAYMFWWLLYTDQTEDYGSYPLVLWLNGGPGVSSTGVGNFLEIGPLDTQLNPRKATWLQKASLLFIDNPVGTGFSYVTDDSALARSNRQIASDLVTTLRSILQKDPEFQSSPLYIFGESYGGKMAIDFAMALTKAVEAGEVTCNLQGVTLADSWISPLDYVRTWGPYLYATSFLDERGLLTVQHHAHEIHQSLLNEEYSQATEQFGDLQDVIDNFTNSVSFYNILTDVGAPKKNLDEVLPEDSKLHKMYCRLTDPVQDISLPELMNGPVRQKFGIIPKNVTWVVTSWDVFRAVSKDFMKDVIDSVDWMLANATHVDVTVYNGQLDLIVDTLGTLAWVRRLQWPGLMDFLIAPKMALTFPQNHTGGFVKSYKQLNFFWILKAGHMVPIDAPKTALKMLERILSKK